MTTYEVKDHDGLVNLTTFPVNATLIRICECKNFRSLLGLERCKSIETLFVKECPLLNISALEQSSFKNLKSVEFDAIWGEQRSINLEKQFNLESLTFISDEFSPPFTLNVKIPNSLTHLKAQMVDIQRIDFNNAQIETLTIEECDCSNLILSENMRESLRHLSLCWCQNIPLE